MSFNPARPYAFNFVQGQTPYPTTVVYTHNQSILNGTIQLYGFPQWLTYENLIFDSTAKTITFTLKVIESYANSMAPGDYSGIIILKFREGLITVRRSAGVTLNVQQVTLLTINPSVFSFSYIIGGSLPLLQTMQIQSGASWSIENNASWLTLSSINGFQNGSSQIGVNPIGLTVGEYSTILEIADGQFTKQATVLLSVSQGNTPTDFLYVTPEAIQFVSELAVANTTQKTISLETSHAWTTVVSQSWLVLSASSGTSGNTTLNLSVDSAALTNTEIPYLGTITFNCQDIEKTIYVQLYIVDLIVSGLQTGDFLYADDRNELLVTNILANNFLILESVAYNGFTNTLFNLRAPYQNGSAKVLLGQEANNLLKSVSPPSVLSTGVNSKVKPLSVDYKAINKNRITDSTVLVQEFQNIKFLKGKTPEVVDKLCYAPNEINLSKKGVLSLSVLANEAPSDIVISGAHDLTFTTAIANDLYVYNAIINMADIPLVSGEQITVSWGGLQVVVNIIDNTVESNMIAFENEWGEYEFFECTGFIQEAVPVDKLETELQVEGKKHTKVVSIDVGKEYILNTGWVLSQLEIDWLVKILSSKRLFLYRDGLPNEIILETKSLDKYKTREYYRSYSLNFKKAII
ncbi:BACON domain-containing protein [Lacinutrix sp. Hel_I_90]|uniref:BACON domain-containing protein n=1 Tax=Lacinutrix sp. Hel_I_90 TaxID=1249999 RepID=UPI0005C9C93E|nr:BACON domain-containing protein [Lacinutrix sp. Hel_I_90]